MEFNSMDFIIFFPAVVLLYWIVPKKLRVVWLLGASYFFYMSWNPGYAVLIAFSTLVTYASGLLIQKSKDRDHTKAAKFYLAFNVIVNLAILVFFKYSNFLLENAFRVLDLTGLGVTHKTLDILLPVGISFYTFQALSYTFDVYKGQIAPEKNILKYALYVSFFPQLVAGPIERSTKLLPQIQHLDSMKAFDRDRVKEGLLLMLWGFFQKLMIADRAAILVKNVTAEPGKFGSAEIVVAVVLFAIQIYCDFGGYTNIARGAAKVMGFDLMANFRQPYFATSIREFWRRWHISLTSWFTDYLYIPLGGNRKGKIRKYLNILVVFAVSGLWHGAGWHFVIWGLLHAAFQIAEDVCGSAKKSEKPMHPLFKIIRIVFTFILADFAWIFFVGKDMESVSALISGIFAFRGGAGWMALGLDFGSRLILLASIVLLFAVDLLHEMKKSIYALFEKVPFMVRIAAVLLLFWGTVIFGIYGSAYDVGTFIYFQF